MDPEMRTAVVERFRGECAIGANELADVIQAPLQWTRDTARAFGASQVGRSVVITQDIAFGVADAWAQELDDDEDESVDSDDPDDDGDDASDDDDPDEE